MRTILLILTVVCFYPGSIHGQDKLRTGGFTREMEGVTENDFLFFEDYYYTAGQDFVYRRLISPGTRLFHLLAGSLGDSTKAIIHYRYGLKIFNPIDIYARTPDDMDRPYAGWTYVNLGVYSFRRAHRGNRLEIETGIVGGKSGMEQLQQWIHKITTYDPPEGWEYQIRNEWVVNLYYSHFENWALGGDADIVSQSSVQAGTGGNKLSQDLTLRLMHFNPISNSAFTQSRLSWDPPEAREKNEVFIFVGAGIDYVISSIFIEGSVFKENQSVFTVPAEPWVFRPNVGIMYSNRQVSCSATFHHLTKEVARGTAHDYASIRLAFRF